ncbi:MAG: cobalamin-binding protein [Chloroflexi bacterium]|nr:cobalamin-binding protein [Chloroflexota bacterium]
MSDEINIREMAIDELLELMGEDLYDGYADEVVEEVNEALSRGMSSYEVLTDGLVAGMDVVGADFRDGVLFVPEVLMAAKAMKAGMVVLRPLLAETGAPKVGTMVLGTVKGDIHDIGKNLVGMMMEGAGFEVINIGINNDVDAFIEAVEKHDANIVGMSALLTTTMPYMRVVIDALKEKGLRDQVVVLVGGAPLNDAFAEDIEADAYCRDAAVAVETAKKFMAIRAG